MAINLGSVNFRLGADTSALNASVARLKAFGNQVDAAAKRTGAHAVRTANALRKQEKAAVDSLRSTLSLNRVLRQSEYGTTRIKDAQEAWKRYNAALTAGKLSAVSFQRAQAQFNNSLAAIRRDLSLNVKTTTGFSGALRRLSQESVLIYGPMGGVATRLNTLASMAETSNNAFAAFAAGMAVATIAVVSLGAAVLNAGSQFDRYKTALTGILGTSAAAEASIATLKSIARDAGVEYAALAPSFMGFVAATKNTALEGKKAEDIMRSLAKVIGLLQLPAETAEGAFKAVEQMMSKGKVQAEELRGQLGDRIPGAFQIAARAMGVSTAALSEMTKEGKLLSEDFLPKFAAELERTFGTDKMAMIDNYKAAWSRMMNSFTDFFVRINELTGLTDKMKRFFDAVASGMEWLTANITYVARGFIVLASSMTTVVFSRIIAGAWAAATALLNLGRTALVANAMLRLPGLGTFINVAAMAATAVAMFGDELGGLEGSLARIKAIAIGIAVLFGSSVVVSFAAAAAGAGTFAAALVIVRTALIRTGIGALIVLLGEAIYWFTELAQRAGGFGNALSMLWDVAKEVFQRIKAIIALAAAANTAKFYNMVAEMLSAIASLATPVATAANFILNSYVAAYQGIIAAFKSLPAAMGDLVYQAANAAIEGVESMLNGIIDRFNKFTSGLFSMLNSESLPEFMRVNIDTSKMKIDPINFEGVSNPYANGAGALVTNVQTAVDEAFARQPIKVDPNFDAGAANMRAMADAYGEAAGILVKEVNRPLTAWERLKALFTDSKTAVEAIGPAATTTAETATNASDKMGKAAKGAKEKVKEIKDAYADLRNSIAQAFEDGFMSIVDGTASVKQAFKNTAAAIIKELYRVMVVQRIVGSWQTASSAGTGILGFISRLTGLTAPAGAASGGKQQANKPLIVGENGPEKWIPDTSGYLMSNSLMERERKTKNTAAQVQALMDLMNRYSGVAKRPQKPMQNENIKQAFLGTAAGGRRKRGQPLIVGENGPEKWIPDTNGTMLPSKDAQKGGEVYIEQHLYITTGIQATVRAEIMSLMPKINEAAVRAVQDARARGRKM